MHSKHFIFLVLLFSILSLAACGGGEPPAVTGPDVVATQSPVVVTESPLTTTNTVPDVPHKVSGYYDPFEGALAGALPWQWRGENPTRWSLTENPGFLRLYTAPYADGGENILLLALEQNDFTATTHVLFEPSQNFQFAGLTLFVEGGIFVTFGRSFCGFIPPCVGNGIYFDNIEEGTAVNGNFATEVSLTSEAWLRLQREGDALTGSYSADGETWQVIGTHTLSVFFAAPRIGLIAGNDMNPGEDIPADFDFFDLTMP